VLVLDESLNGVQINVLDFFVGYINENISITMLLVDHRLDVTDKSGTVWML